MGVALSHEGHKVGGEAGAIEIAKITADDPWAWIRSGWSDMGRSPLVSLSYGLGFSVISAVLVAAMFWLDASSLALAAGAGFMIVGPMLAVGMYEASRRMESGRHVALFDVLFVSTRSPAQLAFLGIMLMGVFLVWMRVATLLFALFFGDSGFPPLADFVPTLLLTPHGLGLLVVGTIIGSVLAVFTFAISAISVPLLMARDVDAVTAVIASVQAVQKNFWPMMLWGWIIAFAMGFGIATLFVGMIFTFPLVGHATWHAYRALVKT